MQSDKIKASRIKIRGFTEKIPIVQASLTLGEVQSFLFSRKGEFETIDYIYVTDSSGILTGIFSITDIYRYPPQTAVSNMMKKQPLFTAQLSSHPEEIAYLSLTHGLKAVPIVDENRKLLGAIPHDAITRILHRELREDILHLTGVNREALAVDNIMEIPLLRSVGHRIPWLVIGTLGGLLIASVIGQFEETLQKNIVLAAFIPLVVYIADAVGTQMEAFVIRDFAIFRKLNFGRYFGRHFIIVLILAVLLGLFAAIIGLVIFAQVQMCIVLGLAVGAATLSSLFSGLIVPYIFRKFKLDPANASGPLGTIIQDVVSVAIYFTIAAAFTL